MLFPVLKPATWAGLHSDARVHVWIGSPRQPSVVVAYAWHDADERLRYVTTANGYGRSDDLVREAFHNLEHYTTEFELVEADGDRMLVSAGKPLTAERVLCESHMQTAHEKLDADELVVAVPHRGLLLACARDGGEQVRRTMAALHREAYDEAVTTGDEIFDQLIVLREGAVAETFGVGRVGGDYLERWDRGISG
ncbi:MAG: hypothetical protein OEV40_29430 [Acidimicrobiia bacterium]|nr:hypothetical protein [Acidimicrobiia bacterium]